MRSPPPSRPGEVNYSAVDRFTLVHASIGVAYELAGLGFLAALALSIAWELLENPLKVWLPAIFPHPRRDSWRNSLVDTVALMIGWTAARALTA